MERESRKHILNKRINELEELDNYLSSPPKVNISDSQKKIVNVSISLTLLSLGALMTRDNRVLIKYIRALDKKSVAIGLELCKVLGGDSNEEG